MSMPSISLDSGVVFFGAEGSKPISWNTVQELCDMVDTAVAEEQSKIFAAMRGSPTITLGCTVNKKSIRNLMEITRGFKLARGPARNRMIRRAKKMQTNYIYEYTFIKEGDEYVDERGQVRLILQ